MAAKQYFQSLQVPQNVLVCRPCRDDITRAACNPGYIPRWEKGRKENNNSGVTCFVKLCEKPIFAKAAVKGGSTCIELKPNAPHPLPLCKAHYHTVYDALCRHNKDCRTCGRRLQGGGRRCPHPEVIQLHLSHNTDFDGQINDDDRVCQICYKSHLLVLKESQPVSTDSDLEGILETLKQEVVNINHVQDVLIVAMNKMLIGIGIMLLEKRASLMPTIHSEFINNARALYNAHDFQEPLELKSITSRLILSEITAKFQHHVTYACRVRKHGTLIFRPTADLIALLRHFQSSNQRFILQHVQVLQKERKSKRERSVL